MKTPATAKSTNPNAILVRDDVRLELADGQIEGRVVTAFRHCLVIRPLDGDDVFVDKGSILEAFIIG